MSYSRADGGDFADHIQEHYEKDGHQVFVDFSDIKPGEDWSESIKNAIDNSDFIAVIVTRSALKSAEVEKEIIEAKKQNKTIIPCRYRGITWNELKWDLNKLQGFQFDNKNSLIRQLDDIIFSKNNSTIKSPLPLEVKEKVADWRHTFSNKRSKKALSITVISIVIVTAIAIGIGIGYKPSPPIPTNKPNEPMDINALFNRAVSSYKTGQYSNAIDSFNKVLQMEPNNVTAIFLKGSSLYKNGNYQDAIDSFNKVLQNNTNNSDAMLYKGLSLYNLKLYDEAILQFNTILAENPTNIDAMLYKGLSLYNQQKYNQSLLYYDKILEIDPHNINDTKEEQKILEIKKNQSNIHTLNK